MAARVVPAAVVFAAAVVVYAVVQSRRSRGLRRDLAREQASSASHRLMAGCMARDLEVFRRRLNETLAQQAVVAAAALVLDESLAHHDNNIPPSEGGPR